MNVREVAVLILLLVLSGYVCGADVGIRYPSDIDGLNLRLRENEENVFEIILVSGFAENLIVFLTDNNDNSVVVVEYPKTILLSNEATIPVKIKTMTVGKFWFRLHINCFRENSDGQLISVKYYGLDFRGTVKNYDNGADDIISPKRLSINLLVLFLVVFLSLIILLIAKRVRSRKNIQVVFIQK